MFLSRSLACKGSAILLGIFFAFALLFSQASAQDITGPRLKIQEGVYGTIYNDDGDETTATTRRGWFYGAVPNNQDVLQYINVTLSAYTNTDIQSDIVYDNFLSSPTADTFSQTLYVDTSAGDASDYYTMTTQDAAPTINLSLNISNWAGGYDVFSEDNIDSWGDTNILKFNFTVHNPSSSTGLNGINIVIQFETDTNGVRDVLNITQGTESSVGLNAPSVSSNDGGDNDFDRVTCTGDLSAGEYAYIVFNATILTDTNWLDGSDNEDLDGAGGQGVDADWGSTSGLFSGVSVSSKFSRGPIREGIDLSQNTNTNVWSVRAFIRHMGTTGANGLTYNLTEWRLYEVDPATGAPFSSPNITGTFNQSDNPCSPLVSYPSMFNASTTQEGSSNGRFYTTSCRSSNTSWYNTTKTTKVYYSAYFDWEVLWNSTGSEVTYRYVNTTMNMPILYEVDMAPDVSSTGAISPETGGEPLNVSFEAQFVGNNNAEAKYVRIISMIPANTTNGDFHDKWMMDTGSFIVYFRNDTDYEIDQTGVVAVSYENVSDEGAQDGYVQVVITDLSQAEISGVAIGDNLDGTELIRLEYMVTSNSSMQSGDEYDFYGNATFQTNSGTQLTEAPTNETVTVSAKRLLGYKDLIAYDVNIPTLINGTIIVEVQDSTGSGIDGIKFVDYVPNGTINYSNYVSNLTVRFYDGIQWNIWANGTDYNVSDLGVQTLSDGLVVRAFEFVPSNDTGWNLTNGQIINVSYQLNITQPGLYILPVEIAGFDPITGEEFRASDFGVVKIVIPEPSLALQKTETELTQVMRILVGKPGVYTKQLEVYNPNPRTVKSRFETLVFSDATEVYASYYNLEGSKVEVPVYFGPKTGSGKSVYWDDSIMAFETRSYEMRVLTPPVLEVDRDVQVLEKLENKQVKLKMDVFLKSFAEEEYQDVVLNLPISYENVFEVRDAFGNKLAFTGGADTISVNIDRFAPLDLMTVTVIYRESYPTIIITPDRDRYNLNSPVGLEILVINGGDKVEYPYVEVEIYTPGMEVIFSDIASLESLEPLEKTEMYEKFQIPATAPGGMYIASAKFREDFVILASTSGNFFVTGLGAPFPEALQILAVIVVAGILIYFSFRRLRLVRSEGWVRV